MEVRVCRIRAEYLQPCFSYGSVKVTKGVMAEAWGYSAKKVAEAWPDTEANEEVSLIRGIAVTRTWVRVEEEAVEDGYEAEGFIR